MASAETQYTSDVSGVQKQRYASRKGAACLGCRRQKIRCTMPDAGPPCIRCNRRNLPCAVEQLPQLLSDNDNLWKRKMEKTIMGLQRDVQELSEKCARMEGTQINSMPIHAHAEIQSPSTPKESSPQPLGQIDVENQTQDGQPDHHWKIVMSPDSALGDLPGSCVSRVPNIATSGSTASPRDHRQQDDIVLGGIISEAKLRSYFELHQNRFDHFLYRIIGERHNLESLRASSSLLTAVICAIGSLHTSSGDFQACHNHFTSLVEKRAFIKENSIDDVLALVLGAYWLNDISWALVSAAVRMAIECQLQRSLPKALEGDKVHYLRIRLYYLVFICDHHCSIAYGRPPLTRRCEAIRAVQNFISSPLATEDDTRMAFQIDFWSLMEDIWEAFGVNVDKPLDHENMQSLSRFNIRLETIRAHWTNQFRSNPCVGNYAAKGSVLCYHFGKLYLFTHALRGVTRSTNEREIPVLSASIELENAAHSAIISATAMIRTVVADGEVQSWLNGFHSIYHIMVAFAAVFLLKILRNYRGSLYFDAQQIHKLLDSLVLSLTRASLGLHHEHWLTGITTGIKALLSQTFPAVYGGTFYPEGNAMIDIEQNVDSTNTGDELWLDGAWNSFDMGNLDFFGTDAMAEFLSPRS